MSFLRDLFVPREQDRVSDPRADLDDAATMMLVQAAGAVLLPGRTIDKAAFLAYPVVLNGALAHNTTKGNSHG